MTLAEIRERLLSLGLRVDESRLEAIAAQLRIIDSGLDGVDATVAPDLPPATPIDAPRSRRVGSREPDSAISPATVFRTLDPLHYESGAEIGRQIASRRLSAREVIEHHIARISSIDGRLNAFVHFDPEMALANAERLDRDLARGHSCGPLHGVPIAYKDIFDTAGVPTGVGSSFLRKRIPPRDARAVERLAAGGTVSLGKVNLHEFAYGLTTDNPHYGRTRNPWNLACVPGGSSGGSAAGLAAGLFPLSLGTDTGASVRLPAAACGVAGLKPTFGRVSRRGVFPLSWTLDHVGPMARTVEDLGLLLDTIAGHDAADPWSHRSRHRPTAALARDGIAKASIGFLTTPLIGDVDAEVAAAMEEAVASFSSVGFQIHRISPPPVSRGPAALLAIIGAEAADIHRDWLRAHPDGYGTDVRTRLEMGLTIGAHLYARARRIQAIVRREIDAALALVDVLVLPTIPHVAPTFDAVLSREPTRAWNRLVSTFNLSGHPALSLLAGVGGAGMPFGLQIVGRAFDEATVLGVGRSLERALGAPYRGPPGYAA
ncbi:MAG: amidase [Chloroflexi bacterium]|nr:amidase [Chloroflexota bacterium]